MITRNGQTSSVGSVKLKLEFSAGVDRMEFRKVISFPLLSGAMTLLFPLCRLGK